MSKSKLIPMILALAAGLSILFATTTANATWPFLFYQPKAPKSLIKKD